MRGMHICGINMKFPFIHTYKLLYIYFFNLKRKYELDIYFVSYFSKFPKENNNKMKRNSDTLI